MLHIFGLYYFILFLDIIGEVYVILIDSYCELFSCKFYILASKLIVIRALIVKFYVEAV